MKNYHSLPHALIFTTDTRFGRLLETELSHLGLVAYAVDSLPAAPVELYLLIADLAYRPLSVSAEYAKSCGCPLLAIGRETVEIPADRGVFLRRPFALTELESLIRRLLADLPVLGSPVDLPRPTPEDCTKPAAEPILTIDPETGTVTAGGHPIPLTPAERAILAHLYAHRGETVPREALAPLLGGSGNSVDVYICHLRTKIEKPLGRRMIQTVRGVGYRMDI